MSTNHSLKLQSIIMLKKASILLPLIAVFALLQCETPGNPDFTLSTNIDSPLIAQTNFQFLGDKNAIIDTTNKDLQELFEIDGEDFITMSQMNSFDFGDLSNAVPNIAADPTAFESDIGEIELNNLSSQDENGNLGEASFQDLTGLENPLQEGDPLPGAQSPFPVNIELETDFFVSAQIKSGGIEITFRNELGFDLDNLTLELYSGNNSLGIIDIDFFVHNSTRTGALVIVENPDTDPEVELSELNADVEISWPTQTMQDDAGNLIINKVSGQQLIASSVNAVIQPQEFFLSGSSDISDEEFIFSEQDHYVQLSEGILSVQNIINTIDLDIDLLEISFPGLRTPPYSEADSLVILFDGAQKIPRNNTSPVSRSFNLDDVRIYAENNLVDYNIKAITENTQESEGSDSRTIQETDKVNAEIEFLNLKISEVFGVIANRQILLNTEISSDGSGVELMNNLEAEVIEIDGIHDLSRRVEGIEFTRASLSINYSTNVDVQTSVIGAFLGIDAEGNQFFLHGEPGTNAQVQTADPTEKLLMNGQPIEASSLIKFEMEPGQTPDDILSSTFDRNNSNITAFLNRLPTSVRFVGLANINEDGAAGKIQNPVRFDPTISFNIPLALKADRATFTDTTKANLEGLPGPNENAFLEEGSLTIRYSNRIPLGINLQIEFLTEEGDLITSVPLITDSSIEFVPAQVGSGKSAISAAEDFTIIQLNRSQLDKINQTRNVRLIAGLSTTASEEIRIRKSDDVDVTISGKFVIRNKFD